MRDGGNGHDDYPQRQEEAERDERRPLAQRERQQCRCGDGDDERPLEPCREVGQFRLPPAGDRADAHQEGRGRHQYRKYQVEIGRADRGLGKIERVEEQRVHRAQEHRAQRRQLR